MRELDRIENKIREQEVEMNARGLYRDRGKCESTKNETSTSTLPHMVSKDINVPIMANAIFNCTGYGCDDDWDGNDAGENILNDGSWTS